MERSFLDRKITICMRYHKSMAALFRVETHGPVYGGVVTGDDDTVYFGSSDRMLHNVDCVVSKLM